MAMAMVYVFKEPRHWKNKAAQAFPFMYVEMLELEKHIYRQIDQPGVYHVTAFNTYGKLIFELYKSEKTKNKIS